jgi:hypothetical protein
LKDFGRRLAANLQRQGACQVALVHGDLVLAEPAALEVAEELARLCGGRVEAHRRPASLPALLQDLRTFSLFGSAKVVVAIDTAIFADRSAAADLVDDAEDVLPLAGGEEKGRGDGGDHPASAAAAERSLTARERLAAGRLMQVLRLFEIDAGSAPAAAVIEQLPAWVLEGGRSARRGRGGRARGKRQVEELRAGLAALLEAARREDVQGGTQGDLSDLAAAICSGLPAGHLLVLAEREVAPDHPLMRLLAERDATATAGEVEADRGGWQGVDLLAAQMAEETGMGIASQAMAELARRTLRKPEERAASGPRGTVTADSTARLAGEYRKLAHLAKGAGERRIELRLVEETVEDRGEEDVWKLLDAIGAGHAGEAMGRLQRLLASADDPLGARLSFFALLATFCRRMTAIRGMMRVARLPAGEANYQRFTARLAPALQADLPDGKNPLAGINAWALHRAYLAASRLPEDFAARLPWEILETELQLKGESTEADAALARLVVQISSAASAPGQGRRAQRPDR